LGHIWQARRALFYPASGLVLGRPPLLSKKVLFRRNLKCGHSTYCSQLTYPLRRCCRPWVYPLSSSTSSPSVCHVYYNICYSNSCFFPITVKIWNDTCFTFCMHYFNKIMKANPLPICYKRKICPK
jgi:hypothetical protein